MEKEGSTLANNSRLVLERVSECRGEEGLKRERERERERERKKRPSGRSRAARALR